MSSDKSIRPKRETAESKAETTKRISQELQQTEADIRDAKTQRLRAARLAMEDTQPEPAPAKRAARKTKTATRSKI